jgi:hypothetical protein
LTLAITSHPVIHIYTYTQLNGSYILFENTHIIMIYKYKQMNRTSNNQYAAATPPTSQPNSGA